ncbi:DUF998 domain-containing protein [Streptomyces sp. NBC_00233]|uniref:DUF998 domain-containing protein n=1 Tax=Streptomyces sp. NBC_00233 TaxID=2975686 RepID=UPI002253EA0D|nr:DUF998 domain-containing protein [Streptomyces sp. NBC_00233]MCX5225853.1 DUF998 domain-containing protein [Streptomyces sp. NBC_00233]
MPGNVTRASAALAALGALAYTAWVLEVVLRTGLDPVRTYVSELAASDQPFGTFFRATDLVSGALVLAGAVLGWAATTRPGTRGPGHAGTRRPGTRGPGHAGTTRPGTRGHGHAGTPEAGRAWRTREPWAVLGWGGLALFGAATVADSRLPLSCAATVDPACAARETAGLVPATHTAHAVSSGLAMTGALVALVALTVAARRYGRWRPLARTGPVVVALELAATVWTLAAVAAFEAGKGAWALGVGQRLQVLLVAVWLAVLAYSLATSRPTMEEER